MGLSLGEANLMKFDEDSGDDGSMNENSGEYEKCSTSVTDSD